ncbi:MAG: AAA family ATPase [Desulfobulbaceae bacterium]|nr:AAA family ATPase [Desulfobulbaceae bacterium]
MIINKWILENFKAVKERVEIPLAPLTVFTGPNSSGKSAVLKSMLLVAQTYKHKDRACPLLLNGPLVSLGKYESIVHSGEVESTMHIGYEFNDFKLNTIDQNGMFYSADIVRAGYGFRVGKKLESGNNGMRLLSAELHTAKLNEMEFYADVGGEFDIEENPVPVKDRLVINGDGTGGFFTRGSDPRHEKVWRVAATSNLLIHGVKANNLEFEKISLEPNAEIPIKGMDLAFNKMREQFTGRLLYLGPLREEPKPLYPLFSAYSVSDIGNKGEKTIELFAQHKDDLIDVVSPKWLGQTTHDKIETERKPLKEALCDWLHYLGVAYGIQTSEVDYWGAIYIVADRDGKKKRSLNHVGIGVSQIMPILVMGLLAEQGTTMIIEQPELHLHPKVQSRLGDFFLSMMMLKKQCIIESHSEHIINRLRLRMVQGLEAEGKENFWSANTKIYFTEKNRGISRYREVSVDSFNCGSEWPEGFFDESGLSAEKITMAAIKKRRSSPGTN